MKPFTNIQLPQKTKNHPEPKENPVPNSGTLQKTVSINSKGQKETNWTVVQPKHIKAQLEKGEGGGKAPNPETLKKNFNTLTLHQNKFIALCDSSSTNFMGKDNSTAAYSSQPRTDANPSSKILLTALESSEDTQLVKSSAICPKTLNSFTPLNTNLSHFTFTIQKTKNQSPGKQNHGLSVSFARKGTPSIPIRPNLQPRILDATNTTPETSSCNIIPSNIYHYKNPPSFDIPGSVDQQIQLLLPGYFGRMGQSKPMATSGHPSSTPCSTPSILQLEDDSSGRPDEPGTSPRAGLIGCREFLHNSGDYTEVVDSPTGKRIQLPPGSMGLGIPLRPGTRSSTRAKSTVNYKELAHGSSSKRNRQRQMDSPHQTMQPNDSQMCLGPLKENGTDVGHKSQDKLGHCIQQLGPRDDQPHCSHPGSSGGRNSEDAPH